MEARLPPARQGAQAGPAAATPTACSTRSTPDGRPGQTAGFPALGAADLRKQITVPELAGRRQRLPGGRAARRRGPATLAPGRQPRRRGLDHYAARLLVLGAALPRPRPRRPRTGIADVYLSDDERDEDADGLLELRRAHGRCRRGGGRACYPRETAFFTSSTTAPSSTTATPTATACATAPTTRTTTTSRTSWSSAATLGFRAGRSTPRRHPSQKGRERLHRVIGRVQPVQPVPPGHRSRAPARRTSRSAALGAPFDGDESSRKATTRTTSSATSPSRTPPLIRARPGRRALSVVKESTPRGRCGTPCPVHSCRGPRWRCSAPSHWPGSACSALPSPTTRPRPRPRWRRW